MKQILPLCLAVFALAFVTACNERGGDQNITLSQEPANPTPTISVNGDAFVEAKPDEVGFSVSLLGRGETAKAATGEVNTQAAKMIEALKKAGVKESDIRTGYVNVSPEFEPQEARVVHSLTDKPKPRAIVGYNATYSINFTLTPLDKMDEVSKVIQNTGFNSLNGPSFSLADPSKYEGEALEMAYADALAKAEKLAAKAGMKITGPRSINGNANGGGPRPMMMRSMAAEANASPMPLEAGVQRINANVSVTFNVEPAGQGK